MVFSVEAARWRFMEPHLYPLLGGEGSAVVLLWPLVRRDLNSFVDHLLHTLFV